MQRVAGRTSQTDTDVAVIGGGHNGLITAAYLAKTGLRVALFEARSTVGGCASSEGFAGATVNICNCDHLTFRTTPVMEELGLAEHGLRYLDVDPTNVNMSWEGGPAWLAFHDVERTIDSLSATHPSEVANYRRYLRDALPAVRLIFEAATAPPSARSLIGTAIRHGGRGAATLLRWSRRSAADVIRSYFATEPLRGPAMAVGPVVWGISPETPGTGLGALTYAIRHVARVGRPVGGSGAMPASVASALVAAGGAIHVSSPVEAIDCADGRARGVTLADGTEVSARAVVSACDPHSTFLRWLRNPPAGAGATVDRWRTTVHHDGYESKIDAIATALPTLRRLDPHYVERFGVNPLEASITIAPTLAEMHRGAQLIGAGEIIERPSMFANFPTALDPTMAPPNQHVVSLEVLHTPYQYVGGWADRAEPTRWLNLFGSEVDDGWVDTHVGEWRAMTPDVYEREFHLPKGHATSFAGGPLAALRPPAPELVRYRTAVPGLYLTGAATFPGAGIWGASGRNCAHVVTHDLDRRPLSP